jgi:hypothetical protein
MVQAQLRPYRARVVAPSFVAQRQPCDAHEVVGLSVEVAATAAP